jgi:hypothetical protein
MRSLRRLAPWLAAAAAYDVITFNNFVPFGDGSYAANCHPARF